MKPAPQFRSEVADGVGFEPTRPLRTCRFSRPVPSTARPPILLGAIGLCRRAHSNLARKRAYTTTERRVLLDRLGDMELEMERRRDRRVPIGFRVTFRCTPASGSGVAWEWCKSWKLSRVGAGAAGGRVACVPWRH